MTVTVDTAAPDQLPPDSGVDLQSPDQGAHQGPLTITVLKLDGIWDNDLSTAPAAGVIVVADLAATDVDVTLDLDFFQQCTRFGPSVTPVSEHPA